MKRSGKSSPMARLMALAGEQKKQYVRSIILAVIGVAAGMLPYFAVARMVIALLSGVAERAYYGRWCLIAAAG